MFLSVSVCVLQALQKAREQGDLPAEVFRVLVTLVKNKQAHVVAQAALAGLVLVAAAAWLVALLLLPVCWMGLGGASGCSVSCFDLVWADGVLVLHTRQHEKCEVNVR